MAINVATDPLVFQRETRQTENLGAKCGVGGSKCYLLFGSSNTSDVADSRSGKDENPAGGAGGAKWLRECSSVNDWLTNRYLSRTCLRYCGLLFRVGS